MKALLEARPTLIVTDCQSGFMGNTMMFPLLPTIISEYYRRVGDIIEDRAQQGYQIVLLEFEGYGETVTTISNRARRYSQPCTLAKNKDDILDGEGMYSEHNKAMFAPLKAA
jgi:hypothetical protein